MNKSGLNEQIEFLDNQRGKKIAKLDSSCRWYVMNPGVWEGPYLWLRYWGTDLENWKTCINNVSLAMQSTRSYSQDDDNEMDGNNPTFQFNDWDGKKWSVDRCVNVSTFPNPAHVQFFLRQISF